MTKSLAIKPGVGVLLCCAVAAAGAQTGTVYRCPGPPVLYTDQITPQQAKERDCRTIEGAPITVVSPPKPRPVPAAPPREGRGEGEGKVEARDQRVRDSDARKILEVELRREEAKLAEMQKEYNHGAPERIGGEQNYQKYLDRVEQMKAALERKQSDVAALKRELAKLPAAKE